MTQLPADFARALRANPQKQTAVIIRTTLPPADAKPLLETRGFTVTRTFSLMPAVAATATGEAVLALQSVDWITHIEPDSPVHTT